MKKDILDIIEEMDIPIHEYEPIPTPIELEFMARGLVTLDTIEITEVKVAPRVYIGEVWRVCALPWYSPAYRNGLDEVCVHVQDINVQIPS